MNLDDDKQCKCKYYLAVMFWGINMPKHHLARIHCKDVVVCNGFPAKSHNQMQVALDNIKESNVKRARVMLEVARMGRSLMAPPGSPLL
jgi:hypothetical protein